MKSLLLLLAAFSTFSSQALAEPYGASMRFASINLLHDFPFMKYIEDRLEVVADTILRENIDVVGVQEASDSWRHGNVAYRLSELTGYYVYWTAAQGFWWAGFQSGQAILSKYPISELEELPLGKSKGLKGFFEKRSVLKATVESPWGPVNFYSAHLTGSNPQSNHLQAQNLGEYLEERPSDAPSIIVGDLNAVPESQSMATLRDAYGWVDTWDQLNPNDLGLTCCVCIIPDYNNFFDKCGGKNNETPHERVDYVLMRPGQVSLGSISSSKIILNERFDHPKEEWMRPSDHFGVMAEIQW